MALLTTPRSLKAFISLIIIFGFGDPFGYACIRKPSRPSGDCNIEVWTRPLSGSSSRLELNRLHHWGILFRCPDRTISFEALKGSLTGTKAYNKLPSHIKRAVIEVEGSGSGEYLIAEDYEGELPEDPNNRWTTKESCGGVTKSAYQIKRAAFTVKGLGDKYSLRSNNCQTFVQNLYKDLTGYSLHCD